MGRRAVCRLVPRQSADGQSGREGEEMKRPHGASFLARGEVWLACGVTVGALFVLFYPFPPPVAGKLIEGVDKVAHVILFGGTHISKVMRHLGQRT